MLPFSERHGDYIQKTLCANRRCIERAARRRHQAELRRRKEFSRELAARMPEVMDGLPRSRPRSANSLIHDLEVRLAKAVESGDDADLLELLEQADAAGYHIYPPMIDRIVKRHGKDARGNGRTGR